MFFRQLSTKRIQGTRIPLWYCSFPPARGLAEGLEKLGIHMTAKTLCPIDVLPSHVVFAHVIINAGPIAVGHGKLRVNLQGAVVVRDGLVVLAFESIGIPPIVVGLCIVWVNLRGTRDGLVVLTFESIGLLPIVVGRCIVWINLQCPAVIRDGLVVLAFVMIASPPIVVGICMVWVNLQGPIEVGNGLVVLAFVFVGHPTLIVGIRIVWVNLRDTRDGRGGGLLFVPQIACLTSGSSRTTSHCKGYYQE